MAINRKTEICRMYDKGMSHQEIAQFIVDMEEMDDLGEAIKVVSEVILIYKRKPKEGRK